ncbi:hypothetical protein HAX54_053451 [Datura stramonium]|uniref:Uncharacterized protein n=1 Tax=Datura stramonium TaxID=4076 RepID=A0ABS8T0F1_DATST|nr:hypothetical protein [Datura stramonium]
MTDMEKLILEHMEVMREQLTRQRKSLERVRAKLTEMMAEAALSNEKVEASEAQLQSVADISQFMKQEEESQSLDYSLLDFVYVEEVYESEDVNHNSILE